MPKCNRPFIEIRAGTKVVERYYFATAQVEIAAPDHACGPDCPCWAHARQLRGDDGGNPTG